MFVYHIKQNIIALVEQELKKIGLMPLMFLLQKNITLLKDVLLCCLWSCEGT